MLGRNLGFVRYCGHVTIALPDETIATNNVFDFENKDDYVSFVRLHNNLITQTVKVVKEDVGGEVAPATGVDVNSAIEVESRQFVFGNYPQKRELNVQIEQLFSEKFGKPSMSDNNGWHPMYYSKKGTVTSTVKPNYYREDSFMKTKTKRVGFTLFAVIIIFTLISAITGAEGYNAKKHSFEVESDLHLAAGDKVTIMDNGVSSFETIVVGQAKHANVNQEAVALESFFYPYSKHIVFMKESASTPTTNIVTYGRVSRVPLSVRLADDVDSRPATSYVWGLAYENGVLSLYANSKIAINAPVSRTLSGHDLFRDMYAAIEELITDGKLTVSEGPC